MQEVSDFLTWFNSVQLIGKESRFRSRFVNMLSMYLTELENKKREIVSRNANKDSEGNPVFVIDQKGRRIYDIPKENSGKTNEEYQKLMQEDCLIVIDHVNKEIFKSVKDTVLNTDFVFGPTDNDPEIVRNAKIQLANKYALWCESFETLDV